MIELKNISVHFEQKGKDIPAVNEVNLSVSQGDIYGIVGYSGARERGTGRREVEEVQKGTVP